MMRIICFKRVFLVVVVVACLLCGFRVVMDRQVKKNFTETEHVVLDPLSPSPRSVTKPRTAAPTLLPRLTDCTVEDVRNRSGVIVLTTTNAGFLDILLNLLESIRRTKVCPNITIIAEDQYSYAFLRWRANGQPGLNILKTNSGYMSSDKLMVRTGKYNEFVNKRAEYLLNFLEKGLDVMFTDTDTFWFRDPFPYFQGDFDVAMLDERMHPKRKRNSVFCDGLAYYKPTERTLRFVRHWVERMKGDKKEIKTLDQNVMNDMLRHNQPAHLEVRSLNPSFFPKGSLFYDSKWRHVNNNTAVMHSSEIEGHEKKVAYYKEHNMWLPVGY